MSIAWPDEESGQPEAYYNDSRNVHLFYEADQPRRKRFACKWWIGDDGHRLLTLYYPDRLEYYRSTNAVTGHDSPVIFTNEVTNGKSFVLHRRGAQPLQHRFPSSISSVSAGSSPLNSPTSSSHRTPLTSYSPT